MRRVVLALALPALALLAALTGCGGDDRPALKVSAAASLKEAFTTYGEGFEQARAAFSFAGSDELAAQIRQGARPEVFASANTRYPERLFREVLVERPVDFAANRLVLAVPADGDVRSLAGAARPGVRVAIGAAGVPIGGYTRQVLRRLGATGDGILRNVRSEEPDVNSIVGKLVQGGAQAGLVYVTDVTASGGRLRSIQIPAAAQPRVVYAAAVVKGAKHPEEARAFVDGLLTGRGRAALRDAGFEAPSR